MRKAAPSDLITWSASFADVTQLADADGAMCAALGLPSAMDAPAFTAMKVYGPDGSVQLSHQSAAALLPSVDTVLSIVRAAAAARGSVPAPSVRKVWYAPNTFEAYGTEEIDAVTACLRDGWLAPGPRTEEFERRVSAIFKKKCGVFVNSGSSGITLALAVLGLEAGAEIVTPACTFSTSVAPMLQLGFKPVFVDVEIGACVCLSVCLSVCLPVCVRVSLCARVYV